MHSIVNLLMKKKVDKMGSLEYDETTPTRTHRKDRNGIFKSSVITFTICGKALYTQLEH